MVEEIGGKYLVVRVKPQFLEEFAKRGYTVNPEKGLVCLTEDYEYMYAIGGKYVYVNIDEANTVRVADTLEEMVQYMLEKGEDEDLFDSIEEAFLYEGFPWLEKGWTTDPLKLRSMLEGSETLLKMLGF